MWRFRQLAQSSRFELINILKIKMEVNEAIINSRENVKAWKS